MVIGFDYKSHDKMEKNEMYLTIVWLLVEQIGENGVHFRQKL